MHTYCKNIRDKLDEVMEPNNTIDKYVVAILIEEIKRLRKILKQSESKAIFYSLIVGKENSCKVTVRGKTIYQQDRKAMKVP